MMLKDEEAIVGTDPLDLVLERGGNLPRRTVGDDRDAFLRLEAQANVDRVARTGQKLGINGMQVGSVGHLKVQSVTRKIAAIKPGYSRPKSSVAPAVAPLQRGTLACG